MNRNFPITRRTALLSLTLTFATAGVLCFCSCKTPPEGAAPAWVQIAAAVAQNVASAGVYADLQANPSHRAAYQTAESALTGLIDRGNWNSAEFTAIITNLPIVLNSPQGVIWASSLVFVYDAVTSTVLDVHSAPAVEAIMRAARDGIRSGLSAPASRNAVRYLAPKTKVPKNARHVVI